MRWRGLLGVAGRRVIARLTGGDRQQVLLSVAGVAVAVALVLVVTSVGLGLLTHATVGSADTDYWIVPQGGAGSAVTDVEAQRLGQVHPVTERLMAREDVTHATPVLVDVVRFQTDGSESRSLLVIGVIPATEDGDIVGLSTNGLTPGDPHYADGAYDGPWTGEAILSTGAATALDASPGEAFHVAGAPDRRFEATAVDETRAAGVGQFPVAVVHLSELQDLSGATQSDSADQILVRADGSGSQGAIEDLYPGADVLTRQELLVQEAQRSQLPVAMAFAALTIAIVVGVLFLVTTMGLAVAADSPRRAVLSAVGFSTRSRAGIVAGEVLVVALLGGVGGVILGVVGVWVVNAASTRVLAEAPVATFHPLMALYGLGIALLIGLMAVPYLLVMGRRSTSGGGLPV